MSAARAIAKGLLEGINDLKKVASSKDEAKKVLEAVDSVEKATSLAGDERKVYLQALDTVYGDKEKRAKDLGFSDKTYYHGTGGDFDSFKNSKLGSSTGKGLTKGQHWFSDNPEVADIFSKQAASVLKDKRLGPIAKKLESERNSIVEILRKTTDAPKPEGFLTLDDRGLKKMVEFGEISEDVAESIRDFNKKNWEFKKTLNASPTGANTIPVKLRSNGIEEMDASGKFWGDLYEQIGNKEISVKNLREGSDDFFNSTMPEGNSVGIKDTSKIRSKFAAFDPRFKDSKNLMAGAGAISMGAIQEKDPDKMSVEEIEAELNALKGKSPDEMSLDEIDAELAALKAQDKKSLGDKALDGLKSAGMKTLEGIDWLGNKYDSIGIAPTKSALAALAEGKDPGKAFKDQFGGDSDKAPSGKEVMQKFGMSDDLLVSDDQLENLMLTDPQAATQVRSLNDLGVTKSGAAGMALEMLADPVAIATGGLVKGIQALKGLKGAKTASNVAAPVTEAVPELVQGIRTIDTPEISLLPTAPQQAPFERPNAVEVDSSPLLPKGLSTVETPQISLVSDPSAPRVRKGMGSTIKDSVTNSVKSTKDAVLDLMNPTVSVKFGKFIETAQKIGMDPEDLVEAHEFGDSSIITRAGRTKAEGPLGQVALEKHERGLQKVRDAVDNKIHEIGGGASTYDVDVGNALKAGHDAAVDSLLSSMKTTYSTVAKANPNLSLNAIDQEKILKKFVELESWANSRILHGSTKTQKEQALQVKRAMEAFLNARGNFAQSVEAMQLLGETAWKAGGAPGDIPIDAKKMRELYHVMSDGIVNTTRTMNPKLADELVENNKKMTKFFSDDAPIKKIVGNQRLSPEKVVKSLIDSGDSKSLASLKEVFKDQPELMSQVKAYVLDGLINRRGDELFSFKPIKNNMQKKNVQRVLNALFEPGELDDFIDIVDLGDAFGLPIMSTSGTGASNALRSIVDTTKNAVVDNSLIDALKQRGREKFMTENPGLLEQIRKQGIKKAQ